MRPWRSSRSAASLAAVALLLVACGQRDSAATDTDNVSSTPIEDTAVNSRPPVPADTTVPVDDHAVGPSLTDSQLGEFESPTRCTQEEAGYGDEADYLALTPVEALEGVFSPKYGDAKPFIGEIVSVGRAAAVEIPLPDVELEARRQAGEENPTVYLDLLPVTYRVLEVFGDPDLPATIDVGIRNVDPSTVNGCGRELPSIGSIEFVGMLTGPGPDPVKVAEMRLGIDKGLANPLIPLNYRNSTMAMFDGTPIVDIAEQAVGFRSGTDATQPIADD